MALPDLSGIALEIQRACEQLDSLKMKHVFVETNWVVGYAAPAHFQLQDALALTKRAEAGDFRLYNLGFPI